MKRLLLLTIALAAAAALGACSKGDENIEYAPRNLTVLVGGGRGTSSLNAYFPQRLPIRAGDTVTWVMNKVGGDDPHTVTFTDTPDTLADIIQKPNGGPLDQYFHPSLLSPTRLPGDPVEKYEGTGYYNSGIMFGYDVGVPMVDQFQLTFNTPGEYRYYCGIHEFHKGTIVVEPKTTAVLPNQPQIDDMALKEMEPLLNITEGLQDRLVKTDIVQDQEVGPNGTSIYIVAAGMGSPDAEVVEFFPRNLTIKKGDTVAWASSRFHAVVFNPGGAFPPFYVPETLPNGSKILTANPQVLGKYRANTEFNGTGLYSSGLMGYGQRPGGIGYTLTFAVTGKFNYMCPIHRGMVGTVTVEE
ncbi:MAG: hypothetical protein FJ319_13310 [SAR202 cluster bacterium]|nr:hypothetical protein [SAR202 cluster bacterium]